MPVDYYRRHGRDYFAKTVNADAAAILRCVVEQVPPPARVLDLGCGSGRDLAWLKGRGYTAFGMDTAPELASLARRRSGCPVVAADFTAYPLRQFRVDILLAVGSLVHLPHEQLPGCLHHLVSGLSPKEKGARGHLYLSFKAGAGLQRGEDGRTFYLWRDAGLQAIFSDLGLEIMDTTVQRSALAGDETTWLGYLLKPTVGEAERSPAS